MQKCLQTAVERECRRRARRTSFPGPSASACSYCRRCAAVSGLTQPPESAASSPSSSSCSSSDRAASRSALLMPSSSLQRQQV